eukprot:330044-Hanusia_phi.AAC.1
MMLFTLGCHDYTPGQHEKPTGVLSSSPCSPLSCSSSSISSLLLPLSSALMLPVRQLVARPNQDRSWRTGSSTARCLDSSLAGDDVEGRTEWCGGWLAVLSRSTASSSLSFIFTSGERRDGWAVDLMTLSTGLEEVTANTGMLRTCCGRIVTEGEQVRIWRLGASGHAVHHRRTAASGSRWRSGRRTLMTWTGVPRQ